MPMAVGVTDRAAATPGPTPRAGGTAPCGGFGQPVGSAAGPDDRGDIVLGWLTKVVLVLSLGGIVVFDALSVGVSRVSTQEAADRAARAASTRWQETHDVQQAYDAAVADAAVGGREVPANGFSVLPDGTVRLRVTAQAVTLVAHRVAPLRDVITTSAAASAGRTR